MLEDIPQEEPIFSDFRTDGGELIDDDEEMPMNMESDGWDAPEIAELNEIHELHYINHQIEILNTLYLNEIQFIITKLAEWANSHQGIQEQQQQQNGNGSLLSYPAMGNFNDLIVYADFDAMFDSDIDGDGDGDDDGDADIDSDSDSHIDHDYEYDFSINNHNMGIGFGVGNESDGIIDWRFEEFVDIGDSTMNANEMPMEIDNEDGHDFDYDYDCEFETDYCDSDNEEN